MKATLNSLKRFNKVGQSIPFVGTEISKIVKKQFRKCLSSRRLRFPTFGQHIVERPQETRSLWKSNNASL